jgi:hypothetical protein
MAPEMEHARSVDKLVYMANQSASSLPARSGGRDARHGRAPYGALLVALQ